MRPSAVTACQKLAVCCVFLMGIFVIVAAILTKYFNLSDVYSTEYMKWYSREASVALYVANIPLIWPLIRRVVPGLANAHSSKGSRGHYNNASSGNGGSHFRTNDVEMTSGNHHSHLHSGHHNRRLSKGLATRTRGEDTVWETESQEAIFGPEEGVIRQDLTVTVQSEKVPGWSENMKAERSGGIEYSINIQSKNPGVTTNTVL